MALTLADFLLDFPEFESYDPARLERILLRAASRINETEWRTFYNEAQGLIAAHLLTIQNEAASTGGKGYGVVGGVQAMTVTGSYSVNYATSAGQSKDNSSAYSSTIYGREFEELQRRVIISIRIY